MTVAETPRVLLYEPGKTGHRPVILELVTRVLDGAGIGYSVGDWQPEGDDLLLALDRLAAEHNCNLIHIMSLDGLPARLAKAHLRRVLRGGLGSTKLATPAVGTLYAFAHVTVPPKSVLSRIVLKRLGIEAVLAPDVSLRDLPQSGRFVRYLPDPVDTSQFNNTPRQDAIAQLGLQASSSAITYLAFGELSERKGLSGIVNAFTAAASRCADSHLLLAGRINDDVPQSTRERIGQLCEDGRCTARDDRIPESDVGLWYAAADFYLTNYPAWFRYSSGTFSRACVAGVPTIAAAHGQTGSIIRSSGCGYCFPTGDESVFAQRLVDSASIYTTSRYAEMREKAARLGEQHGLDKFADALVQIYRSVAREG